jgi:hypothetical protein
VVRCGGRSSASAGASCRRQRRWAPAQLLCRTCCRQDVLHCGWRAAVVRAACLCPSEGQTAGRACSSTPRVPHPWPRDCRDHMQRIHRDQADHAHLSTGRARRAGHIAQGISRRAYHAGQPTQTQRPAACSTHQGGCARSNRIGVEPVSSSHISPAS